MKVKLFGAAQTVTGSCYMVTTEKARFTVDCGMHQGGEGIEKRNLDSDIYEPEKIDFILLTHAHIDHSGLLPRMAKKGFKGKIYCTEATAALLGIMLQDSAFIQEMEAEWASRKRERQGQGRVEPLYTIEDAINVIKQLSVVKYNTCFLPAEGISACYRDAGHILGSAFLELEVKEKGGVTKTIFSGDLGRPKANLMENPSEPTIMPDYLFLESTYGDRDHKNEGSSEQELLAAIYKSYEAGEKTIIPAFAVERTQEIVYILYRLHKQGKLPPNMPIYVDSPLAVKATKIFKEYSHYLDKEIQALIAKGEDPFSVPGLTYVSDVNESKQINEVSGPAIIISASGMCNAGRIKHHLFNNLFRKGCQVVFTGYQAIGTPGRKLVDGAKSISIFGEIVNIEADIVTIGGFSGHAGQSQILDWVDSFDHAGLNIILTHGETKAQATLSELLQERFKLSPTIPGYLEELTLLPGSQEVVVQPPAPEQVPRRVSFETYIDDIEHKLSRIRAKATDINKQHEAVQTDVKNQLTEINNHILQLLSEVEAM